MTPEARESSWKARCEALRAKSLVPSDFDLERAKQACRFSPWGFITDAMLILNCGNWLTGESYDAVLSQSRYHEDGMDTKKTRLDNAAEQLTSLIERHLETLAPAERADRIRAFDEVVAKIGTGAKSRS